MEKTLQKINYCVICDKRNNLCVCEKKYGKAYIEAFKDGYRKAKRMEFY